MEQVLKAVEVLKRGGIILYPTDTVWGIGCDATNKEAVEKIYALKKSATKKSMLILVDNIDRVGMYVHSIPSAAIELFQVSSTPLTLILPDGCGVAENLIPDEGTIAIRIVNHDFCSQVIKKLGRAIVSTSANISDKETPSRFEEISEEIIRGVDLVVDKSNDKGATGKASSIISIGNGGEIKIIRQ